MSTVYGATVYRDDEYNAAVEAAAVGFYPTEHKAIKAVRAALAKRGDGWHIGSVNRYDLIPGTPGVRPDEYVNDDRYETRSVGPTWVER